ncbi:MAG: prepilin-type cleavage/methylation domain-containing protein, partial [Microcystaceae cyanobacterium]
ILAAVAIQAKPWFENPLEDNSRKLNNILSTARMRALATTSTYRVRPDPNDATRLTVEFTKSGNCAASTTLTADATTTTQTLTVASVSGFATGDTVKVGSDSTNNTLVSVDPDTQTLTLGQDLGTSQPANSGVVLLKNWANDGNFSAN